MMHQRTIRAFPILQRLGARLSVAPFRILAYFLHATTLDRVYKPHFSRHAALLELDEAVVDRLPKYCQTISGAKSDPINLVFVATEAALKHAFRRIGWRRANPASPIHITYGFFMALFKRSYDTGPFAPLYVNISIQDLAYQKPASHKRQYGNRHHLRIWRTGIVLSDGKRVWVGAAGCENGMRFGKSIPFWTHALDPNIDAERDYVVRSLEDKGGHRLKRLEMIPSVLASRPARNAHSCEYFTDGHAVVVEL